jgi:23S rRNA (guanosine2251-2'-O)-methyltransferase
MAKPAPRTTREKKKSHKPARAGSKNSRFEDKERSKKPFAKSSRDPARPFKDKDKGPKDTARPFKAKDMSPKDTARPFKDKNPRDATRSFKEKPSLKSESRDLHRGKAVDDSKRSPQNAESTFRSRPTSLRTPSLRTPLRTSHSRLESNSSQARAETKPRAETKRSAGKPEERKRPSSKPGFLVWGRRPVDALLQKLSQNPDSSQTHRYGLYLLGDKAGKVPSQLKETVELAQALGVSIKIAKGHEDELWPLAGDESVQHQRLALSIPTYPTNSIYEVCDRVKELVKSGAKGCLGVVLDQVQDPRNFGSILRSTAFFGASFAVFGEDRQAPLSSTVLKASAGGAFSLQLAPVVNINRSLELLKDAGAWIVGSSLAEKSVPTNKVPLDRAYVLVLGNEGKGIRQEVANRCDYVVKIPGGLSTLDSLNVGVAAGVLLSQLCSPLSIASTGEKDDVSAKGIEAATTMTQVSEVDSPHLWEDEMEDELSDD